MSNSEKFLKEFITQHPQYQTIEASLYLDIFCDVYRKDGTKIATSDCGHSIAKMKVNEEPTRWKIV